MTMTRDKMIEKLIEDRLNEWVYASCTESLIDCLYRGFKGYDDYTDEELKKACEELAE